MLKTKVMELLDTFSAEELKKFRAFTASPYFNTSQHLVELINILSRHNYSLAKSKLTKEIIFRQIYGNRTYCDVDIRKLFFDLHHLAEKFVMIERQRSDKINTLNLLQEELYRRNITSSYTKISKQLNHLINNTRVFGGDILLELFKFERMQFNYADNNQYIKKTSDACNQIRTLNKSLEYLFIFFTRQAVEYYIDKTIQQTKYQFVDKPDLPDIILKNLPYNAILEYYETNNNLSFLLDLYVRSYYLFCEFGELKHYGNLKTHLQRHYKKLTPAEKHFFHTIMLSYCIIHSKDGTKSSYFESELHILHREYLQEELFLHSYEKYKFIPVLMFSSVIMNAINLKKYEWAIDFVHQYSNRLEPVHRTSMKNLGLAMIYTRTADYETALDFAGKINFSNFIFKYELRNLQLRIYTELGYNEEILSNIHAYKEFIRKDKLLNSSHKQYNLAFVSYLEKLIKYKEGNRRIELELLLNKIEDGGEFHSKKWLINKYQEIIEKENSGLRFKKEVS